MVTNFALEMKMLNRLCLAVVALLPLFSPATLEAEIVLDSVDAPFYQFISAPGFARDSMGDFFFTEQTPGTWRVNSIVLPVVVFPPDLVENVSVNIRFFDNLAATPTHSALVDEISNVTWDLGDLESQNGMFPDIFLIPLDYLGNGSQFEFSGNSIGIKVDFFVNGVRDPNEPITTGQRRSSDPLVAGSTAIDGYLTDRDYSGNFSLGQNNPNGDSEFTDFGGPDDRLNISVQIDATAVPEPASFGFAFLLTVLASRRRQRSL